jgi:putative ABC transport system permease protein
VIHLFRSMILRRLLREPVRSATTVAGIALGIAVIIAIQIANASSIAGFERALDAIAGRTALEIVSPGAGVDETRIPSLGWLREYGQMAPVIERDVTLIEHGTPAGAMRLFGVDMLRERPVREYRLETAAGAAAPGPQDALRMLTDPSSAIVPATFARAHGLGVGSTLVIQTGDRTIPLVVRALLIDDGPAQALEGRLVVMDIAAAQQAVNGFGDVDRLDLPLDPGVDVARAATAIAARLPAGLIVERPGARGEQVEQMLAAFHLNLTALSYVALIVGLFLIYNTVSVAVLSRRDEIGMLRAVGVTRRQVRLLFLGEAAALSIAGCALGLAIGRLLADVTVALTSTTVSAIYIATAAAPPHLAWRHVAIAFGVGVPLSLLAAIVPAREASLVPPIAAIRGADRLDPPRSRQARWIAIAAGLLALGGWLATFGPVRGLPIFGYASAAAIVFGASFLVPLTLTLVTRVVERPVSRWLGVADWLAVRNLSAAIPRLSISVAALAVSLSMMTAIAIMVGSFRDTVVYWVQQTLQADLFISPGTGQAPGRNGTLSADVVAAVASDPAAAAIDPYRVFEVPYDGTRIRVVGRDFDVVSARGGLLFKAPTDGAAALVAAIGADAVAASESFVRKHRASLGGTIDLPTPAGPVPFRIVAVYFDYSSDRGVLLMDRQTFDRRFGAGEANGVSVYLNGRDSAADVRARLMRTVGTAHTIFINTNQDLRANVLRVFDSTFAITYALELVAIVVAILGVSATLLTLILERERELTMLRLVGASRRQVRRAIIGEAIVIGGVSQALGLGVGLALSVVLIYVINVQSFGWTIQFHLPWGFLAQSSVATITATALAGLYPARRATARATVTHLGGDE